MNMYDALAASTQSTRAFVAGINAPEMDLPTPCAGWDVRSVLSHLVGTLSLGKALLSSEAPDVPMTPGDLPAGDVLGGDPLGAYDRGVEQLLATAAGPEMLEGTRSTPFGEMPVAMLAGFTTLDIAVHGWDLAKATGQSPVLASGLATHVLEFARTAVTHDSRAPRIGPEIFVGNGASLTDQLMAFMGRQP
jgi:uncharacterized protein (TIGR03086 family)